MNDANEFSSSRLNPILVKWNKFQWPARSALIALLTLILCGLSLNVLADDQETNGKPRNVVAIFHLDGTLTETPQDETFAMFGVTGDSLKDVVARMSKAAVDPAVKAIVILPDSAEIGLGQTEELRAAISLVREHEKQVYVQADSLDLRQYLLACGASQISVTPGGSLEIPGMVNTSLHIRGLLDKIGVKPDFLTEGAYKSAAELFMREQPSPEADEMMNWLMDSWYDTVNHMIADGRKVDAAKVKGWLDAGLYTADQAKTAGLIDAVEPTQDFEAMLKDRYGKDVLLDKKYGGTTQPDMDFSSPLALLKVWGTLLNGAPKKQALKPAVGVVYVDGEIADGKSKATPFSAAGGAYSTDIREALQEALDDDSVKAVVLRIDSPGGSATASEIILDATKKLKAKKPLVVSMGNVAGSGGYYVACSADTIFADATTLTGSIGVLSGKLATTEMWKKVGITFKEYKRGQNAGMLSSDDVFSDSERAQMKSFMDDAYALFKSHVTEIRGSRLKKPIEELAGGRVYTGKQALDLGLVDRIGTLSDAVSFAATTAKIKDYEVRVVPQPKNFVEQLMEQATDKDDGGHVSMLKSEQSLFQLAAPYLQNLDPRRVAAVARAFRSLEIVRKEGVALTMPEITP